MLTQRRAANTDVHGRAKASGHAMSLTVQQTAVVAHGSSAALVDAMWCVAANKQGSCQHPQNSAAVGGLGYNYRLGLDVELRFACRSRFCIRFGQVVLLCLCVLQVDRQGCVLGK